MLARSARITAAGNLWRSGSYDNTEVHGQETLEDQLLYVWTQNVKDGIVPTPEAWPGVWLGPEDFGRTITVRRPEHAFFGGRKPKGFEPTDPEARRERRRARREATERARSRRLARAKRKAKRTGRTARRLLPSGRKEKERAPRPRRDRSVLPETVTFTVGRPPGYEHMTLEELRAYFRRLLDERVAEIHAARAEEGLTHFMGVEAVLRQDPRASAGDAFPTFARNPRIACLHGERRKLLCAALQAWRWAYREALLAWRARRRRTAFPCGSYFLPRFHNAFVERATGPPSAG